MSLSSCHWATTRAGCPQRTGLHPYTLGECGKLALGNRWARAGEGSRVGPGPSVRREKTTAVPGRGAPIGSQEPDPPGYKKALAHPDPGQAVYRSPSRTLWASADGTGVWRSPATLSQELRDQGSFSQSCDGRGSEATVRMGPENIPEL